MRVITGRFKGRLLKTVNTLAVRPAADRVKQTIFDMLTTRIDLQGLGVLDLFAGSGSLGIEAISRGARHVTFVETNREAVRFIEQNLGALGCTEAGLVLDVDAMHFLRSTSQRYDLIFADPPYAFEATSDIPEAVFSLGALKADGWLVIEHSTDLHFATTALYEIEPERKFGRTLVTFFRHRKAGSNNGRHPR